MPILDLQRRYRELGRIRLGQQVAAKTRKGEATTRPTKLDTWRLTSPSQPLLEAAAALYGGTVTAWDAPAGAQWELLCERDTLDVEIPPGELVSQWYELWTGGGCQRRCDGRTNVLADSPCECPQDPAERAAQAERGRACKPTTRLNVVLPRVPDLGVWRVETHGWHAATELAATAELLTELRAHRLIPARLRLEAREVRRPGEDVRRFGVPVLEVALSVGMLRGLPLDQAPAGELAGGPAAIEPPQAEALTGPSDAELRDAVAPEIKRKQSRRRQASKDSTPPAAEDPAGSATGEGVDPAGATAMEQVCTALGIQPNRAWLTLRRLHPDRFGGLASVADAMGLDGEDLELAMRTLDDTYATDDGGNS